MHLKEKTDLDLDAEVIIIGNGPAGLSLSTFLSGWHPFYDSNNPHPDPILHEHFMENLENSIMDQDLDWFQDECAERINPSVGAFAGLYDTLVRPYINFDESQNRSSCLKWHLFKERAVSHIVLGDGNIGGSWNNYDDQMVTVSLANWMDLPGFSIHEWLNPNKTSSEDMGRLPAGLICQYMVEYVRRMGIAKNIRSFAKKFCHESTGEQYWQVKYQSMDGRTFYLKCRSVILASRVVYNLFELKQLLLSDSDSMHSIWPTDFKSIPVFKAPVVIVGDGISAADCVMYCLSNDMPVLQLIRRNEKQLRNVMISRLSSMIYPEYAHTGHETNPNYRALTSSYVIGLEENQRRILLETPFGVINEEFNCVVACVGRRSELGMLEDKYEFIANYQSATDNSLFAVGSVAGDHFVRYLIGGSMQVAQTLLRQKETIKKRTRLLQRIDFCDRLRLPTICTEKVDTKNMNIDKCYRKSSNFLVKSPNLQKQCVIQGFCCRIGVPLRCRTRANSVAI